MEEFDKICEVQSDKASVEITTRFTGVIKKLHYESGEMAIVGKPLVDIDVQEDVQEEEVLESPKTTQSPRSQEAETILKTSDESYSQGKTSKMNQDLDNADQGAQDKENEACTALATPAVRHLTKELGINIADINGSGRDGRVLKEDIYKFIEERKSGLPVPSEPQCSQPISSPALDEGPQKETIVPLTTVQAQMFKTMTRSLSIPHFLYADEIDFTNISSLRNRLNKSLTKSPLPNEVTKLSFLPFIVKAVSLALNQYPLLNARVSTTSPDPQKPALAMRSHHNIGVAMDTPSGLLVPVVHNVSHLTIPSIAAELSRLQALAATGKLSSADLSGGTITVSNIGNIGGTYVSPVIVDNQVAILGIGKVRTVPAFSTTGDGMREVVEKQICNFSWSADHRVVDGATMARAAEVVRALVEEPDRMLVYLR